MRRHRVPRQVPRRLYRSLAQAGAETLAVPAAFIKVTGEAHWHVLNHARAIENGAVVVAPCAVGAVPGAAACSVASHLPHNG